MSEEPQGQVSETNNLREDEPSLQQAEGIPPGKDAAQEDQSVQEARISPEEPADDVEESVDHALGQETE